MSCSYEFGDPRAIRMAQGLPRFSVEDSGIGTWLVADAEHDGKAAFVTIVHEDAIAMADALNNLTPEQDAHFAHLMETVYDPVKRDAN